MVLDGLLDFDGNVNGHGSQGATVPLDARQGVATALAATFEQFLSDCSAAGPGCAFSPGDPEAKWAVLAARSRGAPVTTVDGRRWTYPEIISDTLARPTSYPQLAELLQQLYDTGTATPELLNAVTGSEPLPADTGDQPYLTNRADAYSAIQCSDSTVPTDPAVYSRAAQDADQSEPDFGRIAVFSTIPCAFWQGHDADRYTGPWNRRTSAPILVLNHVKEDEQPGCGTNEHQGTHRQICGDAADADGLPHAHRHLRGQLREGREHFSLTGGVDAKHALRQRQQRRRFGAPRRRRGVLPPRDPADDHQLPWPVQRQKTLSGIGLRTFDG
jgi:hypothetical protein